MTESAVPEALSLRMSVVAYEVEYQRSLVETKLETSTELVVKSFATIAMSVRGATVEHHQDKPIKRVILNFSEGPFEKDRAGVMFGGGVGEGIAVTVTVPSADFPGVWAALRLDRVATLVCTIERGTDKVLELHVNSQGSLFPLFGI
jgi:hypothetical protein